MIRIGEIGDGFWRIEAAENRELSKKRETNVNEMNKENILCVYIYIFFLFNYFSLFILFVYVYIFYY